MSDARSLLKSEKASRQIAHTYAHYSDSGRLSCNLCDIIIKSEIQWPSHLKSAGHAANVQRAAESTSKQQQNKKRKALHDEQDNRKRQRSEAQINFEHDDLPDVETKVSDSDVNPNSDGSLRETDENDAEWLEFQQIITRPAISNETMIPASYAAATISAAPMTAEEIAAQARVEQSEQKGKREAEIEAEKEDAAQALEAEFDDMGELEQRVKRLKEKREALRLRNETKAQTSSAATETIHPDSMADNLKNTVHVQKSEQQGHDYQKDEGEDDANDDDEDEFGDWRFGPE